DFVDLKTVAFLCFSILFGNGKKNYSPFPESMELLDTNGHGKTRAQNAENMAPGDHAAVTNKDGAHTQDLAQHMIILFYYLTNLPCLGHKRWSRGLMMTLLTLELIASKENVEIEANLVRVVDRARDRIGT
ncbi:hypothetical protein ACJX0J_006897, partial [Zea mays]